MAVTIPRNEWTENIRKNYDYLISQLEVKNMLPGLFQNEVINERELEELEKPQSSRPKVAAELLEMVRKVDQSKYIPFLSVVNNEQPHVIAKLGYQKYFSSGDSDSAPVEQTNYEPINRDSTDSEEAPISRVNRTESLRINHEFLISELQIRHVKENGVITEREADELMQKMAATIPRNEWTENIRKNYDYLISQLEVKNMLPGLFQNEVINERELEELESRQTRVKQVSELLGIIKRMDRRKYFPFLKVVYENQPHIVQKLGYQRYFKGSEGEQITGLEQMETGSNQP